MIRAAVMAPHAEGVRALALPDAVRSAAVLATLAYYDLLDLPLTAVQVWRYLLRPKQRTRELGGNPLGHPAGSRDPLETPALRIFEENPEGTPGVGSREGVPPRLSEVEGALHTLVTTEQIETHDGFYFLPGRVALVEAWIQKHARSQAKWRRLRRIVFWLQAVPFLRGVAGTGSLAFENAKESSDLDVLIIAAPDRVWTVRFFLTTLLDSFRLRRRPSGPTRDRVCLNHYLAADALEFPYRSLYTAMEYARLVPLLGVETCRAFRSVNRSWMAQTLAHVFPDSLTHLKTVRTSRPLALVQRAGERVLFGPIGNTVERILAGLQRARIARADITAAPRGRVIATDQRAEFHPHSREAPLLFAFNQRMEELGLAELFGAQPDSGLTL